jgi:septal ring factor EnvC (AmiA/AmiB activator)
MAQRNFKSLAFAGLVLAGLSGAFVSHQVIAQRAVTDLEAGVGNVEEAKASLARALRASKAAETRASQFSAEADSAKEAYLKTAKETAALAARIQQAEANIEATEARIALIAEQRRALNARLAKRQKPLVRLTAALQNIARRPLSLSALRPGSLKDAVYVRAVLDNAMPLVRERTADLRGDIQRGRDLEQATNAQLAKLRGAEQSLAQRRNALAAISRQQQVESQQASGIAMRENERALALAEEARDLNALVRKLGQTGALRRELASLSGPVLRPGNLEAPAGPAVTVEQDEPETSPEPETTANDSSPTPTPTPTTAASRPAPSDMQLPVFGRTITGFGEESEAGVKSTGIVVAPAAGAQVVSPAGGRVAFSGPYRGFGRIVIIEHTSGWTSVLTGLATSEVEAGAQLSRGSPIGVAGDENPSVTYELRRDGKPVNPLEFL